MSSNTKSSLQIMQSLMTSMGKKAFCEGCGEEGIMGSKCECGSYVMDTTPFPSVPAEAMEPSTQLCPFCEDDSVTPQCPICIKCRDMYKFTMCCGLPGSINGWSYRVNDIRYYICPYIGRNAKNIFFGIWKKDELVGDLVSVPLDEVVTPELKG